MSFLDSIGELFGGKQQMPQSTIIDTGQSLGQANSIWAGLAPQMMSTQLGLESQFDPNIASTRNLWGSQIQQNLANRGAFTPEEEYGIRSQLLQGLRPGFGGTEAGVRNVVLQTALEKRAAAERARQEAGGYVRSSPLPGVLAAGLGLPTVGGISQDIRAVQAQRDEQLNLQRDIDAQNENLFTSNMLRIGGSIIGGVIGAYTGNPVGGAQAGGAIGGGLVQPNRVGGRQQQTQQQSSGGNFLSSLMGLFGGGGGGIGGPQNGIGADRQTAYEMGGIPYNSYGA